jgi:hypothetical protein
MHFHITKAGSMTRRTSTEKLRMSYPPSIKTSQTYLTKENRNNSQRRNNGTTALTSKKGSHPRTRKYTRCHRTNKKSWTSGLTSSSKKATSGHPNHHRWHLSSLNLKRTENSDRYRTTNI